MDMDKAGKIKDPGASWRTLACLLPALLFMLVSRPGLGTQRLTQLGTANPPTTMMDLVVGGNLAYVADREGGLEIFDISQPQAPTLKGRFAGNRTGFQVAVEGNRAYLAASERLYIVDVSNPSAPRQLGNYQPGDFPNTLIEGVAVRNNIAYVGAWQGGFQVLDVSNPAAPTVIGKLGVANAGRVGLSGNDAVLAGDNGIVIIDITNPRAPRRRAYFTNANGGSMGSFVIAGALVYASGPYGLNIFDLAAPGGPVRRSSTPLGSLNLAAPTLRNSLLYIATSHYDGTQDLRIFDVSNPDRPLLLAVDPFTGKGAVPSIAAVGGELYAGTFGSGALILHSAVLEPVLRVLSPSGPASFRGGNQVKVHWQADVTVAGTAVNFELWNTRGRVGGWLGYDWSPGGDSTKTLTLPLVPVASDYRIRAISMWDSKIYAESSPPFTITGGPVRLNYPTGKMTWSRNTRQPVGWQSNPLVSGTSVGIELWRGGRRVKVLGYGWNPAGQAVTTVWIPGYLTPASNYKLRITSVFAPQYYDEISGTMTIK